MDPLSQAVLGIAAAQSASSARTIKIATICGMLGGMAADLDVFIRSDSNSLFAIEYHRHFTHSLAFIPVGGLLVGLFCWFIMYIPIRRSTLEKSSKLPYIAFATLGYATHGLLDACTNYGTHLAWPFSNARVSWSLISIIDPIFTVPLIITAFAALMLKSRKPAIFGLLFISAYLSLGFIQRERVTAAMYQLAGSRGHEIVKHEVKPSFGNMILWRTIYESGSEFYIDAIRAGREITLTEGGSYTKADKETVFPELGESSVQRSDIRKFAFFSDEFIAVLPGDTTVIGDIRFSMLPHETMPLWGIRVNVHKPEDHVRFENYRVRRPGDIDVFLAMIRGSKEHCPQEFCFNASPLR